MAHADNVVWLPLTGILVIMRTQNHVVVTGGGLSSLGKGIVASSVGTILASTGQRVVLQKFDPYLNVDTGTMNPGEHGEVYVTDDGYETDLDLGNYERFLHKSLDKRSSLTSGMVFQRVLERERNGDFLGKTVQIIPHVTDEICARLDSLHGDNDIVITEFGGTVGDLEGANMMEAVRIYKAKANVNVVHIHVAFVPYLTTSDEFKTKPAQRSIRDCMGLGFPPDIVVCRTDVRMPDSFKEKVAMAAGLSVDRVFNGWNVEDVYEIPLMFHDQRLGESIMSMFNLEGTPNVDEWADYRVERISPRSTVRVALCGKYVGSSDAYKSVIEAVKHAGVQVGTKVDIDLFDVEAHGEKAVLNYDAVIIPGGFGERGWADKIGIARLCLEKQIPLLGICLGMQAMAVSYARSVCDMPKANSTEFRKDCIPVIDLMEEQKSRKGMGGTLRVGSYDAKLVEGSQVAAMYKSDVAAERHRHRYELSADMAASLVGVVPSGVSPDGKLVEFIEFPGQFWVGCQGHPELKSRPHEPGPLFVGLLQAAKDGVLPTGAAGIPVDVVE